MAGGTASNGGSAGTGGAKASGGTSSGAGGASGVTKSAPKPTAGCGKANPPASGAHDVDVSGTSRAYVITLPTNYDAKTPYRLVLAFHGSGGTAAKIAGNGAPGYFGLEGTSKGDAIFVALQGLETTGGTGWANTNGDDVAFVKALIAQLSASYCVDSKRIFSVGFSYGAIFTDTLGCQMGDVLRAIAPMSGAGPRVPTGGKCAGQTAAWLSHGNADMNVPLTDGQASRNFWRDANHCENMTTPVTPSPCVTYQGCDAGFPVTWCQFDGTHLVPSFAADGVWAFFAQF
jgi:poly(3-hydroxybutyrate) depolymerase